MKFSELSDVDLIVFIKTVHEARFPEYERDPLIWSAPFVVQLHEDLIAEWSRRLSLAGDQAQLKQLQDWRVWRGRNEHSSVVRRILEDPALRRLVNADPGVMRDLLRPFFVDDASLREFAAAAAFD